MQKNPLAEQLRYEQVVAVTHRFYQEVMGDPLLSPFFSDIKNWQEHERHISDFWWGMMGGEVEQPRPDAMREGHAALRFGRAEMDRWLGHFRTTLDQELAPNLAAQWAALAEQIGERLLQLHPPPGH